VLSSRALPSRKQEDDYLVQMKGFMLLFLFIFFFFLSVPRDIQVSQVGFVVLYLSQNRNAFQKKNCHFIIVCKEGREPDHVSIFF
jgi:hypothetical protein